MCLWKSCPKSYSLSVNCQKSKEPNQWKVSLGKVSIPEASRREQNMVMKGQVPKAGQIGRGQSCVNINLQKEGFRGGVTADRQRWHLGGIYFILKGILGSSSYCCLKQSFLFSTLLNNLILLCPESDYAQMCQFPHYFQ